MIDLNQAGPLFGAAPVPAAASRRTTDWHSLGAHVGDIARRVLGPLNVELSSPEQSRFGTNGSIAVELAGSKAGTFYNHEKKRGGGVAELLEFEAGIPRADQAEWLRREVGIEIEVPRKRGKLNIVATYDYRDEYGELLFQVCRLDPKDFRQRRPDPGERSGWSWRIKGTRQVLYRLPEILATDPAVPVFCCEGEKDADRAASIGICATTCPGGAGKWRDRYNDVLAGRHVVLLPDNDDAGRAHMLDVAGRIAPVAASVRVLDLPGLPPKGDLSDWLDQGGTADQLLVIAWHEPLYVPKQNDSPPPNPVDAVIEELNTRYAVVNEAGKAFVYERARDFMLERDVLIKHTFDNLKKLYLNRTVLIGDEYKCIADVWLRHKNRRQYLKGIVLDPTNSVGPEYWNLYTGFSVTPEPGDWSLLRQHILDVICSGDQDHFRYFTGWLRRLFQHPELRGEVALVIRGKRGAGKGTVFDWILRAFGQHGLQISNPLHLVGRFNSHLRDCIVLFADEAFFAGDKSHQGVLQALITERTITIEPKNVDLMPVKNMLHVLMASNETWVVPAGDSERRYFVLDASDHRIGQRTYFSAIAHQMEHGGLAAMIYDLTTEPLGDFEVRDVPQTAALIEQRVHSLGSLDRWWVAALERGYILRSRFGYSAFEDWPEDGFASTELLEQSYQQWCRSNSERFPKTRIEIGRMMSGIYRECRPRGPRLCGEVEVWSDRNGEPPTVMKVRPPGYTVSNLASARAEFLDVRKLNINWSNND